MSAYLPIAEMSLNLLVLLALGGSVGVLSGIFGVGGGFLLTPLLMFLGVSPLVAVGTGASQVIAASVSGALSQYKRGNIDVSLGSLLIAGGFAGAGLGVFAQRYLRTLGQLELVTQLTYVVVLCSIGLLMLIEGLTALRALARPAVVKARAWRHHAWFQHLPLRMRFRRSRLFMSAIPPIVIGAFVGTLTAIMGAGGGFVLIPLLIYLLGLPTRVAIGTSTFQVIFVTTLTTVLQATTNHSVDIVLGLPLMIGGVIGAIYGVGIGQRLKAEQLRVLLGLLVLLVGVRMAGGLVIRPDDLYSIEELR